jgi:hypothetical protein
VITFRIDDVSANTNLDSLNALIETIRGRISGARVMLALSPLVHDVSGEREADRERAFPRKLSAMSDHRNLFRVKIAGLPTIDGDITIASHGLVHVDHRLMGREAQELSIVTSCSLLDTEIFVPPFNKYNKDTVDVCQEHGLELICFEDGWQHVKYNDFDPSHDLYYLHTHDTTAEWLAKWFAP